MAEIKAPLPDSPPPRRPWYRLHLSTWVVLLLTAGILALLVVPGETDGHITAFGDSITEGSVIVDGEFFHHGWPWEYLERYVDGSGKNSPRAELDYAPWLVLRGWSYRGDANTFLPLTLFVDLLIAVAILVLTAFLFEIRRRWHMRIWQFTLRELFLAFLLVAGICSWWQTNRFRRQKEQEVMLAGEQIPYASFSSEYRGPLFLHKLLGNIFLNDFFVITEFGYWDVDVDKQSGQKNITEQDVKNMFSIVGKLRYLEAIGIESKEFPVDEYVLQISGLTGLKEMTFDSSNITDASMSFISHFKNLKRLSLMSTNITNKSIPHLGSLIHLAELDIENTKITPEGFKRLRSLLPQCEINYQMDEKPAIGTTDSDINASIEE